MHKVCTAVVEALQGRRPIHQLSSVFDEDSRAAFTRLRELTGSAEHRMVSSRSQMPSARAVEVSLHLMCGTESRAVAFRLEPVGGQWRCSHLEVSLVGTEITCAASSSSA